MIKKLSAFIIVALILASVPLANPQQPGKVPRIALLGNSTVTMEANLEADHVIK